MKNHKKFNELVEESSRCLLCYDPPCSKVCPAEKDPAGILMSLRFKNYTVASRKAIEYLKKSGRCGGACNNKMYCQRNCIRGKIDRPIKIKIIQESLYGENICEEVK